MKLPWMKFYPQDWQTDAQLRTCSLAARGLWIEMLMVMHNSRRRGVLLIGEKQPSIEQLAAMVGASVDIVAESLKELERAGVFSRESKGGAVFSRRMRKEQRASARARENGRLGGNPSLTGKGEKFNLSKYMQDNPQVNPGVNPEVKPRARVSDLEPESDLEPDHRARARPRGAVGGGRSDKRVGGAVAVGAVVAAAVPVADIELTRVASAVMAAAQFTPKTHLGHTRALGMVKDWLDQGIGEDEILPIVTSMVAASPDSTGSLSRFDKAIRTSHAEGANGGTRPKRNGQYVSDSGYHYRGGPEAVMREAEARSDWNTYYAAKSDMEAR